MADSAKITEALRGLDQTNDNHWTATGQPRLETVRMLAGDQSISRDDVDNAAKDFNRQSASSATAPETPPAPPAPAAPEGGNTEGGNTEGVTGDPVPPVVNPGQTPDQAPAMNVEGDTVPPAPPLPAAPAADGLPTAREPAMVEGGEPQGSNAEEPTSSVEGSVSVGRPPQIVEGTTEKGYNALNSEEDDLRDAQASTAPSPNAPEGLGGALSARQAGGLTNEAGTDESTEQRPGEAQLSPVDRGAVGDADAVASLEAQLAAVGERTAAARGKVDDAQRELSEATAEESRLRVEIEKARPRSGTMPAIQNYFKQVDDTASKQADARKKLEESGVDMKALKKIMDDPATGNIK